MTEEEHTKPKVPSSGEPVVPVRRRRRRIVDEEGREVKQKSIMDTVAANALLKLASLSEDDGTVPESAIRSLGDGEYGRLQSGLPVGLMPVTAERGLLREKDRQLGWAVGLIRGLLRESAITDRVSFIAQTGINPEINSDYQEATEVFDGLVATGVLVAVGGAAMGTFGLNSTGGDAETEALFREIAARNDPTPEILREKAEEPEVTEELSGRGKP